MWNRTPDDFDHELGTSWFDLVDDLGSSVWMGSLRSPDARTTLRAARRPSRRRSNGGRHRHGHRGGNLAASARRGSDDGGVSGGQPAALSSRETKFFRRCIARSASSHRLRNGRRQPAPGRGLRTPTFGGRAASWPCRFGRPKPGSWWFERSPSTSMGRGSPSLVHSPSSVALPGSHTPVGW